jgi:two-component system phosphate regulon response regulator PhoB
LPDGNGLDMCKELKLNKLTSHIPVFLMSANLDNKLIAKDALADDFFSKPFDINNFLSKIEKKFLVN